MQIHGALGVLRAPVTAAALTIPSTAALAQHLDANNATWINQVDDLHTRVRLTLTGADFRLGKAYRLGHAMFRMRSVPPSREGFQRRFGEKNIGRLEDWLMDLQSAMPQYTAKAVRHSLIVWQQWTAEELRDDWSDERRAAIATALKGQSRMWRTLLSGEKRASDMLNEEDYSDAAERVLEASRPSLLKFSRWLALSVGALAAAIVAAAALSNTAASVITVATGVLVALGLNVAGAQLTLQQNLRLVRAPLWDVEIAAVLGRAITRLPGDQEPFPDRKRPEVSDQGTRRLAWTRRT